MCSRWEVKGRSCSYAKLNFMNNRLSFFFGTVPLVLASILSVTSLLLLGAIQGYKQGLLADIEPDGLERFSVQGPNFFEFVGETYLFIAVCSLLFILGKVITEKTSSSILCFASGLGIIFLYWQLLLFKHDIDDSAILYYRQWLDISLKFDWTCLSLTIVLIILEGVGFAKSNFLTNLKER